MFNKYQQQAYKAKQMALNADLVTVVVSRFGIAMKKDGSNGNNFRNDDHGIRIGRSGKTGWRWAITGNVTAWNPIQAVIKLEESLHGRTIDEKAAIAIINEDPRSNTIRELVADKQIFRFRQSIIAPDSTDFHDIKDFLSFRGISQPTLLQAYRQKIIDAVGSYFDREGIRRPPGLRFIGYDPQGNPKMAEIRYVRPFVDHEGTETKSICQAGSNRSFLPIFAGDSQPPDVIHIVEGGFSALGLRDIHMKQKISPLPSILMTGGKDNIEWTLTPHLAEMLRLASEVVIWRENEESPEKQSKTDASIVKLMSRIALVRSTNAGITTSSLPFGCKDTADLNKILLDVAPGIVTELS
jgi:hypothetical protein